MKKMSFESFRNVSCNSSSAKTVSVTKNSMCANNVYKFDNNIGSSNNNKEIIKVITKSNTINFLNMTSLLFAIWSVMTLGHILVSAKSAAIYSNKEIAKPSFEPLCHIQQEHFIESDGKESSLILEFNSEFPDGNRKSSCTRILSAPTNYGFILRLILPKIHHHSIHHLSDGTTVLEDRNDSEMESSPINDMTTLIEKLNATANKPLLRRTCPLSVFSSLDPRNPQWRVDPCLLEDTAPEMEDPVRLFQGRVRIVWEHNDYSLNSKLMVTALGKGEQCRASNKHPCLKIGDEPILCISKDLVCDGIRHCPNSNEYDSDEDCWKKNKFDGSLPSAMESGLFEHFALEVFRNLFAFDVQHNIDKSKSSNNKKTPNKNDKEPVDIQYLNITTTLRKVPKAEMKNSTTNGGENGTGKVTNGNTTEVTPIGGHFRRNSTRNGLHSDLSKYGPWGYLMLGMLLCGGALLICGLWASASQQAANNERESALSTAAAAAAANGLTIEHSSVTGGPPTYEELDPPPAYSVLFPNQKSDSNATLNSINPNSNGNNATSVSPSRPACSGAANLALRMTNTQTITTTMPTTGSDAGISSRQDI